MRKILGVCNKILLKLNQQPSITIRFNWAAVLFYGFFIAYGFFGAITPEFNFVKAHPINTSLVFTLLLSSFFVLGFITWKAPEKYQDSISVGRQDIIIYLSYFAVFFILSFEQLHFSLFCDEINYSMASQQLSTYIALDIAKITTFVDDVPFQYLVQAISFVFLLALLALFVFIKRLYWKNKILLLLVLLFLCRLAYTVYSNGNNSPYPPLNLIPLFTFSTLFGVTDFSFKLAFFSCYSLFILVIFRMMHRLFDVSIAYLLALSIGTIPLLWHLSSIVEPSLWTAICFTLILLEIITSKKLNFIRLVSFIAIATLMRQPTFIAIVPVLILFFIEEFNSKGTKNFLSRLCFLLIPSLLFIPFLGKSLVFGTPSTATLNEGTSAFTNTLNALQSEVIWASTLNSVPYWWILFVPLAFIPLSRKTVIQNGVFLLFFILALAMYYAIHPSFWGLAKYQAEYVLPFAITGMVLITQKFLTMRNSKPVLLVLVPLQILFNTADFLSLPQGNKPVDILAESLWEDSKRFASGYRILAALPYNYREAYSAIKEKRLSEHSYAIGTSYGWFPEVMNGYSIKAIREVSDIKQQQDKLNPDWTFGDVNHVEQDTRIKAVLIGSLFHDKLKLIEQFKAHNWRVTGEFNNKRYGSSVVVLEKAPK